MSRTLARREMIDEVLIRVFSNQFLVLVITSVLLLVSAELGYRLGLRLHRMQDEPRKGQISGVLGAMLGIVGLMLGFTFAMSLGRYEERRDLVIEEANAIGTTYLRAAFLPEAHQTAVEGLLRRYVDERLQFYASGPDRERISAAEAAAARTQRELWRHAVAAGKETPTPLVASFVSSLNDTIDLDAKRLNSLRAHIPGAVWILLLAVSMCGCCGSGYGAGGSGKRSGFANVALPLLLALIITLIADLGRSRAGMILISQQPMLDLEASLAPQGAK